MGETARERACARPLRTRGSSRTVDRRHLAAAGRRLALVLAFVTCPAWSAEWQPNETLVSSQRDLIDPEYSQSRAQFVWNDEFGNLWIGSIDLETGDFVPADGKGILVDHDSMTYDDKLNTWNGPEWIRTLDGDHVLYTKFKGRHADRNARIGYARPVPNGNWFGDFLGPDVNRKAPYGNETPGDPAPLLTYVDSQGNHYVRELTDPGSEQRLTDVPPSNVVIRNVRGARAVLYSLTIGGVDQVHYRDFDTRAVEQLTFDAGMKRESWMWRAPEFGNELVFMTLVDNVELRVYRKLVDPTSGAMRWTPIYSAAAPLNSTMASPEPFTFNGLSYVVLAMTIKPYNFHSAIWISNIDPANPIFRRITDDSLLRARTEPEVFVTSRGPMVYYNRFTPKIERRGPAACITLACSEGVYRADPGLTPQ